MARTADSASTTTTNGKSHLNPEVAAKAKRRRFSAELKLRVVKEADELKASGGDIGAMLRREGLYSSALTAWRRERERGELAGLAERKRGRKAAVTATKADNEKLTRRVARLEGQLAQAAAIIEIQKKVAALLGIPLENNDDSELLS